MKKHLFVALATLMMAAAPSAKAQYLLNNPDNHAYLGLRASFEVSAPSSQNILKNIINVNKDLFSNSPGMSFGAIYNIPVFMNLYVEPGLSLYYNTISQNPYTVLDPETGQSESLHSGSLRMWGLRIPLMVGYHFDLTSSLKIYVFTGPRFSYNFSGRWNQKLEGSKSETENMYSGDDKLFNRFDAQWQFGAGLSIGSIYAAISGNIGMSDMVKDWKLEGWGNIKNKMRKNGFEITVGFNL